MCGIIGYSGTKNAVPILLHGLSSLEYRGYDSAGISVFGENNTLCTVKAKGRLSVLSEKIDSLDKTLESNCGIGHTRWATHGEPSDINSHPHGTERVYIVHNGIIENFAKLKEVLTKKGYSFESETDTETAAKLIDYYYGITNDPFEAVCKSVDDIEGSYAIAAIFREFPNKIYAVRKDSPMIVALGSDGNFVSSDITAVLKYTNKYYRLEQGEIAVIECDCASVYDLKHNKITKQTEVADWDTEAAEKGGYEHFMLKEINEEPDAIIKTVRPRVENGLPVLGIDYLTDERLAGFENIHIVACGTAMHAGLIGKYACEKLARVSVNVEIASEFRYKNPILGKKDLVVIISQSGETADTLAALRLAKEAGVYTLAVVNVAGSTIAREADGVIYTWAGPEIAVASTKAYVVQLCVMYLFALRLSYAKGKLSASEIKKYTDELLTDIPNAVKKAIAMAGECRKIGKKYKDNKNIFFIGRGADYALSMESALKLKEISYIHCEAYAAGELKHGTISLVSDGTPVFALANYDDLYDKMTSNIKEVKARGARVILLQKEGKAKAEGIYDDLLPVPAVSELFMPIPTVTLTQLVSYYTALELECDIDKPRNLAKSVTVE